MFDRKRIIIIVKFLITLLTLILILMLIGRTLAKYETTATTDANIQAAFYLLKDDYQTMTVNLAEMQPRDEAYSYTFSVYSFLLLPFSHEAIHLRSPET